MKVVVITIFILIIFLGGALYFTEYVNVNSEILLNSIGKLDEAVLAEDWETAKVEFENTKKTWHETQGVFELILEHYDLDTINKSIAKIEKYMEIKEKNLALGEVAQLKFVVSLIKKREEFSLSNLL